MLFAILAFFYPDQYSWIAPYIVPLLGIIMFGMGLTLSKKDFAEVFKRPRLVLIGVLGQFIIMPGLAIFAVVVLHNGLGLLVGYWLAKLSGMPVSQRKTLSIEVGMQNSGLGAALASVHFSPLAAVPSAIFSVWHNISGPLAATLFQRFKNEDETDTPDVDRASTAAAKSAN